MADLKARSRARWRDFGYHVENGETILRVPGGIVRRQDLFGFADLVAVPVARYARDCIPWPDDLQAWRENNLIYEVTDPGLTCVWIQSTSWSNVSSRRRKIVSETTGNGQWAVPIAEIVMTLLNRGDMIVVEGWRKRKGRYEVRESWIMPYDLKGEAR